MNRKLFFKTLAAAAATIGLVRPREAKATAPVREIVYSYGSFQKNRRYRIEIWDDYERLKRKAILDHGVEMEKIEHLGEGEIK